MQRVTYIFSWKRVRPDNSGKKKPLTQCLSTDQRTWRECGTGQWGASEGENRVCGKDGASKLLKIAFLFTRRYLGNGESYRDETKTVLKGKELRF